MWHTAELFRPLPSCDHTKDVEMEIKVLKQFQNIPPLLVISC